MITIKVSYHQKLGDTKILIVLDVIEAEPQITINVQLKKKRSESEGLYYYSEDWTLNSLLVFGMGMISYSYQKAINDICLNKIPEVLIFTSLRSAKRISYKD